MSKKPNAMYVMSGGGTVVVSASVYKLIHKIYTEYRDRIGTFFAAVGGMRGAVYEDLTDVFQYVIGDKYVRGDGNANAVSRLNQIKFYATPTFGTSRYNPKEEDLERMLNVFSVHNIHYLFLNGGNDSMLKARRIAQYAKERDYELYVTAIPKTVDNDLLVTHRCPGYASFAKQVVITTMSLEADVDSFAIPKYAANSGRIKEGAVAQVVVFMGRDQGWGAAASILGKLYDSYGPHVILTKEGGFNISKFLDKCQNAWDNYGKLLVVASEGVHDGTTYVANYLDISSSLSGLKFKEHTDSFKNTSVTDSRLASFLKILLENKLNIPTEIYKDFKCREEGPSYLERNNLEILSAVDFRDAIAVGEKAADLAFGKSSPISEVMVTLTPKPGEANYTLLENVADPTKGSKAMTKSIRSLDTPERLILSPDGMMINRGSFMDYISDFIDLNGPNRSELLRGEGFRLPLAKIDWPLEERLLPHY